LLVERLVVGPIERCIVRDSLPYPGIRDWH